MEEPIAHKDKTRPGIGEAQVESVSRTTQATEVSIAVANLEEAQTVVDTHIFARQGHTAQSLQLYDGALHTIAVTVRPVGGETSGWVPPTAVLSVDVVAVHPPLAVQIRMMAILLGVLVGGMVVGFFVPRTYKEQTGA